MLWLLYGIIFTVNAASLAALDASSVLVVLAATTGLGAIGTFFITVGTSGRALAEGETRPAAMAAAGPWK